MEKEHIMSGLAIVFLATILFSPTESNLWILFLIIGLSFGFIWWRIKE